MQFIKNFIEKSATKELVENPPTLQKVQEFFNHCSNRNIRSAADYSHQFKYGIGSLISWYISEPQAAHSSSISNCNKPSYIKWSSHPEYAFLSVINNEVSYYYSSTCESEIEQCSLTTDPDHIKIINELFDYYYRKFILEEKAATTDI